MQFTNTEFANFRRDLEEATKELQRKYQVKIKAGSISYSDLSFDLKLKVTKDEEGLDVEKINFEKYCELYGFTKNDYGRTFTISGNDYELYGFNPRAKSQPCLIRDCRTGKTYKCDTTYLSRTKKIHKCKYCGRVVNSSNEDELCDSCKRTFGHRYYSEL